MGSLVQQINLYSPPEKKVRLNLRSLAVLLVCGVVMIAAAAAYIEYQITQMAHSTAAAQISLQQLKDQLAVQKAKLKVSEDPYLVAELDRLRSDRKSIDVLLSVIESQDRSSESLYSDYLRGLARHPVAGLRIEKLEVAEAQGVLILRGSTQSPALVPKLLEKLSQERVFDGITFSDVVVERPDTAENGSPLSFELRTRKAMEADNAG